MKVIEIRMKNASQIGGETLMGVNAIKHNAEMELHPAGVHVIHKGNHFIVPYGNITTIRTDGFPKAEPVPAKPEGKK